MERADIEIRIRYEGQAPRIYKIQPISVEHHSVNNTTPIYSIGSTQVQYVPGAKTYEFTLKGFITEESEEQAVQFFMDMIKARK